MSGKSSRPDIPDIGCEDPLWVRTGGSDQGERQPRPTEPDARLEQSSPQLWKCRQVPTLPLHHQRGCRSMASNSQCYVGGSCGQARRTGRVCCSAPTCLCHVDGSRRRGREHPVAKSRRRCEVRPHIALRSLRRSSPLTAWCSRGRTPRLENSCRVAVCP